MALLVAANEMPKKANYFISHAWEDKAAIARPLATTIIASGGTVFYDEFSLKLGDSLYESLEKGLSVADHAVVVISPAFLEKKWTKAELRGAFQRITEDGFRIIPVFHGLRPEQLRDSHPILADLIGTDSSRPVAQIVADIFLATNFTPSTGQFITPSLHATEPFAALSFLIGHLQLFRPQADHVERVILELGKPGIFHSRATLALTPYDMLAFRVTDSDLRQASIFIDAKPFFEAEHALAVRYEIETSTLSFFFEQDILQKYSSPHLSVDGEFYENSRLMLGASVDGVFPATLKIGGYAMSAKAINDAQIRHIIQTFKNHDPGDRLAMNF